MDWTMIDNADDSIGRIMTLYYLLSVRYDVTAKYAGHKLKKEPKTNLLWSKLVLELKKEIMEPENDLGDISTDAETRIYLKNMLKSYDES